MGLVCFPVGLVILISFVYQSYDLSGDPRDGFSGDTLISQVFKLVKSDESCSTDFP